MSIESGSSLQTFMSCPRKFYYKYERLLDSKGYSSALGLGSLVHAGVEQRSAIGRVNAVLDELNHIESRVDEAAISAVRLDLLKADGIVNEWATYWKQEHPFGNPAWEWLHSELEFSFPVNADGDKHVGKIDGIVRHKEWNKVFVYELKTATAREKDTYIHRLGVDRQVFANIYAAQEMGFHVDGILYDVIWKPIVRLKKEETDQELAERFVQAIRDNPAEHFHREVTYRKAEDIQDHLYDVQAQFLAIDNAHKQGRFYRNSGACDNYGRLCPYFSVCQEGGQELESVYLKRDRKHPELSKEVQDENPEHV